MDQAHFCRRSRVYLFSLIALFSLTLILISRTVFAQNTTSAGTLTLERPTLLSIGLVWEIVGDDNRNATATLEYRKKGTPAYQRGLDLLRTENADNPRSGVKPGNKLAGSALLLEPGTSYEFRLTLSDPDNGGVVEQRSLEATTRPEAPSYEGKQNKYIDAATCPASGADGSAARPFCSIAQADANPATKAGDIFLLKAGTYVGTANLTKSGTAGHPIVYRGEHAATVILDGNGAGDLIALGGRQYINLEKMTLRNASAAVSGSNTEGIAIRECLLRDLKNGSAAILLTGYSLDAYICDNDLAGPADFPKREASLTGISARGSGHVICHNKLSRFWDDIAITYDSGNSAERPAEAIDIYNNLIMNNTDDAIEADMSLHNIRIFRNLFLNGQKGVSVQPSYAGPTYIFRNQFVSMLSNPAENPNRFSPYKFHPMGSPGNYDYPTGIYVMHNTSLAWDWGFKSTYWFNSLHQNNLIYGETGNNPTMVNVSAERSGPPNRFDYNGYSHKNSTIIDYDRHSYASLAAFFQQTGNEAHGIEITAQEFSRLPALAANSWYNPGDVDLSLAAGAKAIDAGALIPGLNDGTPDGKPDLGALERGVPAPIYGPRTASGAIDADGDGYDASADCDDHDASVYPGARELCDGKDNNCNGNIDEGNVCQSSSPDIEPKPNAAANDIVTTNSGCRSGEEPLAVNAWFLLLLIFGLSLRRRPSRH